MASAALLALVQHHFNETGKMKSLINKRKSVHQPEPIPQVVATAAGDGAWAAALSSGGGNPLQGPPPDIYRIDQH